MQCVRKHTYNTSISVLNETVLTKEYSIRIMLPLDRSMGTGNMQPALIRKCSYDLKNVVKKKNRNNNPTLKAVNVNALTQYKATRHTRTAKQTNTRKTSTYTSTS